MSAHDQLDAHLYDTPVEACARHLHRMFGWGRWDDVPDHVRLFHRTDAIRLLDVIGHTTPTPPVDHTVVDALRDVLAAINEIKAACPNSTAMSLLYRHPALARARTHTVETT